LDWEPAYFISGGKSGPYTESDWGRNTSELKSNLANGADPSCGDGDTQTFNKCILEPGAKGKYNVDYGLPFNRKDVCKPGDGCINLINPDKDGKVAVLEHGHFGNPNPSDCSGDKYDPYFSDKKKYKERARQLQYIWKNCGEGSMSKYSKIVQNGHPNDITNSCVIDKKAFIDAGLEQYYPGPGKGGGLEPSNNGVAISWGHGVGDGACRTTHFLQQGESKGSVKHQNPSNTTLNWQMDMRAWSGEFSDANNGGGPGSGAGYLRDGAGATRQDEQDSVSCLQPQMKLFTGDKFEKLLDTICGKDGKLCPKQDCGCMNPPGYPVGNKWGDCSAFTDKGQCSNYDKCEKGWCCEWKECPQKPIVP